MGNSCTICSGLYKMSEIGKRALEGVVIRDP